jgi:hypothetical protein
VVSSNVVDLHLVPIEHSIELVQDLCRFSESILTEKQIRKKHRLNEHDWEAMGADEALLEKIEAESIRRMRDGSTKREKSQLHVMKAPDVAARVMLDETANNRHRLDACKLLDEFSATGPDAVPAGDRFIISIVLNADGGADVVEHYDKAIKVGLGDNPTGIAAKTESDGDEHL